MRFTDRERGVRLARVLRPRIQGSGTRRGRAGRLLRQRARREDAGLARLAAAARGDGLQGINHKVGENRALERDLKVLYTALTRCRSKLVVLETDTVGASKDASKFFLQAAEQGRSAPRGEGGPSSGW